MFGNYLRTMTISPSAGDASKASLPNRGWLRVEKKSTSRKLAIFIENEVYGKRDFGNTESVMSRISYAMLITFIIIPLSMVWFVVRMRGRIRVSKIFEGLSKNIDVVLVAPLRLGDSLPDLSIISQDLSIYKIPSPSINTWRKFRSFF